VWLWTTFPGGAKPPRLVICLSVDRPGPWWTGSFMENTTFIRASLSDVREIVTIMHVLVEELLCHAMIERIPVLKCLLSRACGHLWLRPVLPSIKWHHYPMTQDLWPLAWYLGYPGRGYRGPKCMSCWGARMRQTWLTGGEILPARGH
jgi:hypothetical protein